jgi:hypothetical protein
MCGHSTENCYRRAKRLAKEGGKDKGGGSASIAGRSVKFEAETAAESDGYAFMARVTSASPTQPEEDPIYIVDPGASHHMVNEPLLLNDVKPFSVSRQIIIGDGKALPATHRGRLVLPALTLKDVLVVPRLDRNLIAVGRAPLGYHWESDRNAATLWDQAAKIL